MDGTSTFTGRRIVRLIAFAAALALPASASTSALADDSDAFVRTFTDISAPVAGTMPTPGAVDVSAITAAEEPDDADEGTAIGGGVASYYGKKFNGRRTASGERFDMTQMTAAHRTLPFGSRVRVTNPANGKSVVVRINDRGPFHGKRVIDLSRSAATELGLIARGSGKVELALLD
ncbi:septal ring lytic transglycosylase RlpA family protein [Tsuneonella sp. YG55]|uniref:Endolytic peptidoglycan transglycosylase RlpA n=1 Tax=Tsuneonella litorea TaxID=2976475 RepID=A0A9X3AN18_9SPHN|nr:septal ring lytic transglycosylase RlpA family protein [Tsuneonella litorea]MCT2559082.1 septal ring lytic transglycosylase RlpA family protein [Tsuneonella litorea]